MPEQDNESCIGDYRMSDTILQTYRDFAERNVAPQFKEAKTVKVDFLSEGSLIANYCNIEYQAIEYALEKANGKVDFTKEEFLQYCKTMVYSRISWVLGNKPHVHPTEHIMVPSFLMNIIMQIGVATNLPLGITVEPSDIPSDFELMPISEMRKISMRLENLSGYEGGFGYPRDKSGAWEFMTMTLVNSDIMRHDADAHPVYALMASVVGPKLIETVLSPIVTYGNTNVFEGLLWQLTSI